MIHCELFLTEFEIFLVFEIKHYFYSIDTVFKRLKFPDSLRIIFNGV